MNEIFKSSLRPLLAKKPLLDSSNVLVATDESPTNTTSKIRVLLFTNSVTIGGMEMHLELLGQKLDRSSFDVYGICPNWSAIASFNQSMSKFVDNFVTITPDRRYGTWRELQEAFRLYKQIRKWKIQCMHLHSTTYSGQLMAFMVAKLAGVRKIFVTEHLAPETDLGFFKKLLRDIFSFLVDGIVCVSYKNYQFRSAHIYTPTKRTIVVNNGIDVTAFPPTPKEALAELRTRCQIPAGAKVVGTVVRFEPEKGLEYLVQAAPTIKAAFPNICFLMVGDGSLRPELESQVASLGLSDSFRFVGFQNQPRPYLELMDVFVLPVPYGSMSIGLLEAMAMHRACVITFGGEGEAITNNVNGLCAKPRDPKSIADAVVQILESPSLQTAFGEAAYHTVETEFSAERVAQQLEQLYKTILD